MPSRSSCNLLLLLCCLHIKNRSDLSAQYLLLPVNYEMAFLFDSSAAGCGSLLTILCNAWVFVLPELPLAQRLPAALPPQALRAPKALIFFFFFFRPLSSFHIMS
ncbi:unnamed protein product, partial [Ectocarpus sp. 8 AP-2014]